MAGVLKITVSSISEEAGSQKPQREFFEYCFERMGRRDVENMLIVGDSLTSDIKGGNTAGIDTCWFNSHEQPNTVGAHVDYEIRSLKELEQLRWQARLRRLLCARPYRLWG